MKWKHKITLTGPLRECDEAGIAATAGAIYAALVAGLPEDLADATPVWEFDALAGVAEPGYDDLNQALDDLYDWADDERVWIETSGVSYE